MKTDEHTTSGLQVLYFSHDECQVCKVLKPKVLEMIQREYPETSFTYINVREQPESSGQFSVFTVPSVILLADNQELVRFVRSFGLNQIREKLDRYYHLYYQKD